MNKDLVTVMIPCFNGEQYISKCLNCLLAQDYDKIQVIIINDGSTDNSEKLILDSKSAIVNKGWIFDYIYQENSGAAAAIANGMKKIQGEFLMLYDVDDILYPYNISSKVRCFHKDNEVGAVLSNGYYLYDQSGKKQLFANKITTNNGKDVFWDIILECAYSWAGSYMIKTELLLNQLEWSEMFISSYGQNLQILLPAVYNSKVEVIEEPLMEYVLREKSVSHQKSAAEQFVMQKGFIINRLEVVKTMDIEKNEKDVILRKIDMWGIEKLFIFAYNNCLKKELKFCRNRMIELGIYHSKNRIRYVVGNNKLLRVIYDKLHDLKQERKA